MNFRARFKLRQGPYLPLLRTPQTIVQSKNKKHITPQLTLPCPALPHTAPRLMPTLSRRLARRGSGARPPVAQRRRLTERGTGGMRAPSMARYQGHRGTPWRACPRVAAARMPRLSYHRRRRDESRARRARSRGGEGLANAAGHITDVVESLFRLFPSSCCLVINRGWLEQRSLECGIFFRLLRTGEGTLIHACSRRSECADSSGCASRQIAAAELKQRGVLSSR